MAESIILVCDECGTVAADTVAFKIGKRNYTKDLCAKHLDQLTRGARRPKPGRKRVTVQQVEQPKRRGRPPGRKTVAKKVVAA